MPVARRFNWEAARVRRAAGDTYSEIARDYGVTPGAVRLACDDGARARQQVTLDAWIHDARCPDCGTPTTRHRVGGDLRCGLCAGLVRATTVRPDELLCAGCREWKPDDAFPFNRAGKHARRGRHGCCRVCLTLQKREWRRRKAAGG